MPYQPILATLGYVLSPSGNEVLLIRRDARADDLHLGKYNGLGGKVDREEDVVSGMKREILEEAGIACGEMQLRGTVSWPGFGKNGEDWFAFIFLVSSFSGEVKDSNAEGSLHWVAREKILTLPLWEGDKFFLPLVFDSDPRPFYGVMPYENGSPVSWHFTRI